MKYKIAKINKQKSPEVEASSQFEDVSEDDLEVAEIIQTSTINPQPVVRTKSRAGKVIKYTTNNQKDELTMEEDEFSKRGMVLILFHRKGLTRLIVDLFSECISRPKSRACKTPKLEDTDLSQRPKSRMDLYKQEHEAIISETLINLKQKEMEEATRQFTEKVTNAQKSIIYSDDSTIDTFEQPVCEVKPTGKGLALLEESFKKEFKKRKTSLKFLLNSQTAPEESDLSFDDEVDNVLKVRTTKKRTKINISQEVLQHYDEVIDFVVKNVEHSFPSTTEDNNTKHVNTRKGEMKSCNDKIESEINNENIMRTLASGTQLDYISDKKLDNVQKLKASSLHEQRIQGENINVDESTTSTDLNFEVVDSEMFEFIDKRNIESENNDFEEQSVKRKYLANNSNVIEDFKDGEYESEEVQHDNETQSDIEVYDIDAPFTYGGSPYVILDNFEEQPENDAQAEGENTCKEDTMAPFTYEGMPLPKEIVDSCSSIGSSSNYPSPEAELHVEINQEPRTKKYMIINDKVEEMDQRPVNLMNINNMERKKIRLEKNSARIDTMEAHKSKESNVYVETNVDNEMEKISRSKEIMKKLNTAQKSAEQKSLQLSLHTYTKAIDKQMNNEFKRSEFLKEYDESMEDSASERSLRMQGIYDSDEDETKSDSSTRIRRRKRRKLYDDKWIVPKQRRRSRILEENIPKFGSKIRMQNTMGGEQSDDEIPIKKGRGRPPLNIMKNRKLEMQARRNIKKKLAASVEKMRSCKVRVVDCKFNLLQPNVHPSVLRRAGISSIRNSKAMFSNSSNFQSLETSIVGKQTEDGVYYKEKQTHLDSKDLKSDYESEEVLEAMDEEIFLENKAHNGNILETYEAENIRKENRSLSSGEISKITNIEELKTGPIKQMSMKAASTSSTNLEADTFAESYQEKRNSNRTEDRSMVKAQVVVKKIVIPKKSPNEIEKPSSSVEIEEKKPNRTSYTNHKGPILNIKVKKTSIKKQK
jgi:hypothetical protein